MTLDGAVTWHYGLVARWWALFRDDGPEIEFFRRYVEAGQPALDLACGTGRLLVPYVASGLDVDGVDMSADMIGYCRPALDAAHVETADSDRVVRPARLRTGPPALLRHRVHVRRVRGRNCRRAGRHRAPTHPRPPPARWHVRHGRGGRRRVARAARTVADTGADQSTPTGTTSDGPGRRPVPRFASASSVSRVASFAASSGCGGGATTR